MATVLLPRPRRPVLGALVSVAVIALVLPLSASTHPATVRTALTEQQQIERKVDALLAKMTLSEKFGQLEMAGPDGVNGAPGPLLLAGAKAGTIGSVLDLTGVQNINEAQRAAMASRLHIPLIFSLDVIHGYQTIFPVPLAESTSWDTTAISRDESVSAAEATADGIKWTFNPMVDVARDPRWGRIVEGAGEDPYLGSAVAAAKVRGYQGSDFSAPSRMAATVKHFAAYGAVEAGREYNTTDMSTSRLYNDYLPPYRAAVDAGAATVMSAFTSLNGVPASANPYLLRQILRQEWGFAGPVVSDYQAVQELVAFGYATDEKQAAQLALSAGVDIEMGVQVPSITSTYTNYGPQLVRQGKLSISSVNTAVKRVLRLKYLSGMFEHPYVDPSRVQTAELTPAHLAAARSMADESMVLLRNANHALPLSPSAKSIAVVGPLADDGADQLGSNVPIGFTDAARAKTVTVLQGIRKAVPGTTVSYAQGCDALCTSTTGFAQAVATANSAALTVLVVGEPADYTGEASSRTHLDLPGQQQALVQAVAATGKPYVVVMMNGRPLTVNWLASHAPALLEAWQPGTEGGNAVADVLFGKVDPSGKLTTTFPRDVGQIPNTYNQLPTGRPYDAANKYTSRYLDTPNTPLYPFGYGLSYTSFALSDLRLATATVSRSGSVTVRTRVTNTGARSGTDVAQLYIHETGTSILQPVRALKGFARVTLAPGQSRTVSFVLDRSRLGFFDNSGKFLVEPGAVDVWVGDSSVGGQHTLLTVR